MHFLPDADEPGGVVAALAHRLAPGSFVAISHLTADLAPEQVSVAAHAYNAVARVPVAPRAHAQISDLFGGLSDTAGNTVTLSGYVCTWAEHDAVVRAARMAGGVVDVRDNIVVTG